MSEKPHTVAIGAFVIGALVIATSTLLFVLGSGFASKERIVMVFDGSVTGLNVGAPVALRGVQVGQVTDVELVLDSDTVELVILVEAEFDPDKIQRRGSNDEDVTEELLARGLRAQLNTQSLLTGLLFIQLDFFPDSEIVIRDVDSPYFQFPTVPSELERITRGIQNFDFPGLAEEVERTIEQVNAVIGSDEFGALPANAQRALASVTELSDTLRAQVEASGPKLDRVLDGTSQTVASANEQLPKIAALLESNLEVIDDAVVAFESAMRNVESLSSQDSATLYQLNRALEELGRAGRSMQSLAQTLEEQPEALIRGRSENP